MIDIIIGSAISAAIAAPDMGSVYYTIKNLESRITESIRTIQGQLDIIKALQILTIYGAVKDATGNIVYTAEDNSKIEYNIEHNDIRCYLSTGELFSINGVKQIVFKEFSANDGSIFTIGFCDDFVVIIAKDKKVIDIPTYLPRDEHLIEKHWYNKKKRYNYLINIRQKRLLNNNTVKNFLNKYPEIIPYYNKWIFNIYDKTLFRAFIASRLHGNISTSAYNHVMYLYNRNR